MHIPDGLLSPPVWATMDAIAIPSVAWVANRAQRNFEENQAPLLGIMGAFVFAAQMINFPVGVGTSGHLVGGALLAFVLGPAAASIVLTAILILQSLIFQDGGVLALGANVTNMALAGVLVAYLPMRILPASRRKLAWFLGGTISLMTSAVLALSELLISGVRIPPGVLAIQLAFFAVSALLEGAITVTVIQSLEAINPGFIRNAGPRRATALKVLLFASVILVTVGFLLASTQPDGIWSLVDRTGVSAQVHSIISAPLADYKAAFLSQSWLSRAVAGLAGLGAIYLVCLLVARVLLRRRIQYSRGA